MKFKDLVNKIQEKNELGKPETTKNYASNTPGQPPVTFTPDTKYDGVALAKELDPSGGIMKQVAKATTNMDIDADGDVDAIDKKNDTIPDEVTGSEKKNKTLALLKKGAAERAHTKKGVAYESVMMEKLSASDDMGKWITDFQKSDAPQFAGKNAEERKKMAIAAKLQADRDAGKNESVSSADKKPETYVDQDGKTKTRMVPTDKEVVKEEDLDERNKENAMKRKSMDASRGSRYKLAGNPVPDRGPEHSTPQAHNKAIGRALRNEGKDDREYGYEGEMAITQLKTIMRHADHMMGMLKPETDLPEWVQSKITLSTDYMQTAHDYMMSEMTEAYEPIEQIDESEDKSLSRLKQLVRFGLMDKSKLPILSRAMKSLEKGQVTNPSERATLFELLNELIGLVTGDDAMFAKVRMNVQNEEVELEEAKASDYQIHHKTYSSAVQHAVDHTNKHSGFTVDQDHYDRAVAMGPRKPSEGKTNTFSLTLHDKNGKESKKKLHMQVYGMGDGKYELNKYVS